MNEARQAKELGEQIPLAGQRSTPILDILIILFKGKRQVVLITLLFTVAGGCIAFLVEPTYTARATILPPQAPQSSISAVMGQIGSLAGLGGAGSLLKNPADTYVGILQSRTIADHALEHFHLQQLWHLKKREDARAMLSNQVQFEMAKDGLIEITAIAKDPQLASALANFFVDELYGMNSHLAITEASQRRLFFDQQLGEEKTALAAAEDDLKNTQLKTGILTLTGQADLTVRSIAQTRALIASKEVQLQGTRTYASDQSPEISQIQQELATLRSQLAQLENSQRRASPGNTELAASEVPAGSLEYARKFREVKYHETLFDLLSRQAEAARIDEAKSAPIIQVIDRAVTPEKKSGPSRLFILFGSMMLGFCASCLWVFARSALLQARKTPELELKLNQLKQELRWR